MRRYLALLIFTTTCALTPPDPTSRPFPTSVPSRYGPVPVHLVDALTCNNEPAYGCFHYAPRVIEIEQTMPPPMRWKVLFHEVTHVAIADGSLHFASPEAENYVADAVAEQRLTEFLAHWPR